MRSEQDILRQSVIAIFALAGVGVLFGVLTGSSSIIFDGIYSALDGTMTLLSLLVARLITQSLSERTRARLVRHFTMGFWHLEPMVLGLSGALLIGAALYALITAISSLLSGGRELQFGQAIFYAVVTLGTALAMAAYVRRENRHIGSLFLALDAKAWAISAALSGALLVAFCFGWAIEGGAWAWMQPYVDPAILAVVSAAVLPMPIPTVRQALADILLVTPRELKAHIDAVAEAAVARYGFLTHRAYVARVGRGRQIELFFIAPHGAPARTLEEWDAIRDEVGNAIGDEGPDRWLTIAFTTDPEWAA